MSNAPSKPVSFSLPKVGYFSNRPRISVISSADGRNCRPKRVAYVRSRRMLEHRVLCTLHCDTIM